MQVKLVYDNRETGWLELTKQMHRKLLQQRPKEVIVRIEDLYPGSPDTGEIVRLTFEVFTVLTREFVLEENRQKKQMQRHLDIRPLSRINPQECSALTYDPEEELIKKENRAELIAAFNELPEDQRRRVYMYYIQGMTLREIEKIEGKHFTTIKESIQSAITKIKEILEGTPTNDDFLSD